MANRWIEKVLEVRRVSERVMVVRVIVGRSVLNLISVCAPHMGYSRMEKEEFLAMLGEVVLGIDSSERLLICGDLNGHVGSEIDGFEGVHGGFGFGKRNVEGEMILEFADALNLAVLNTWFKKKASRLFTYESGECRTVVDYILSRKSERKMIRDVKVVKIECITQHRLLICVFDLKERVVQCKVKRVKRCKVWKLKQTETKTIFSKRVRARAVLVRDESGDVEKVWKDMKDCFLEEAVDVCGETQGIARQKETWWWNEEVAALVKEKQRLFKLWKGPKKCRIGCRCRKTGGQQLCRRGRKVGNKGCSEDLETRRQDYNLAKIAAKRAIFKAKSDERKKFCEDLEREDEKGNVFRVTQQMVRRNRDVVGASCVKGSDGKIVVDEDKLMDVWRAHYDGISNEEFAWDREGLTNVSPLCVGLVKGFRHWKWMRLLVR